MMRLVFLLSAEERGLFLLGDETYDSTYAVSTVPRAQLEEEANSLRRGSHCATNRHVGSNSSPRFAWCSRGAATREPPPPGLRGQSFSIPTGSLSLKVVNPVSRGVQPRRTRSRSTIVRCFTSSAHCRVLTFTNRPRSKGSSPAFVPGSRRRTDRPCLRGPARPFRSP